MSNPLLHIAIIPDGNRRWAKALSLLPWDGHQKAVDNFQTLTEWCQEDERIGVLTVWCFSTENWKRDPEEIGKLMQMLEDYLQKERSAFLENNTRFIHSGRTDRIPESLKNLIAEVAEETNHCDGFTLHLAVDYGGKDEIKRAIEKADSDDFEPHLDHPEIQDIDLIIRTSGEHRTSNFFLWQSTYAEWDFIDKRFPDFTTTDLQSSVDQFSSRTRRFGK
ncbi:di-trans,poly-cis-decaprenylcistransferase [Candidatus Peregrinibacteria bacterium]|nr:di-trans,poly-cis-decaprenylcistransferase [Candidatus Peregrinibacteria bacterium]MBT5468880.1 di-trans,poly-cis-decaprenylcistransferase [Candidatus Peregrinibacteria bacterium]MBT7337420.1 di-trans,poly-cis-decaprenylcistransferase [Candidatus Peregrinibacteria bacterium]